MGGGYAGIVTDSTQVTVDGKTFIHRVYGGGFGDPETTANNTTGMVGGDTHVYVKGANIYGDVFGGGAGVAPKIAADAPFTDVARVYGKTMVEVSDDAKLYGNVYGGGDIANVGPAEGDYQADYTKKPVSETSLDQTVPLGEPIKVLDYKADDYSTFVNLVGGDIFGEVFGGGKGVRIAKNTRYDQIGRISGNTIVHIANTTSDKITSQRYDYMGNNVPYIWGRIYGGCAFGTVDGNTLVHVEGGMLGLNIFGGGYGDVPITGDETSDGILQSTSMSTLEQVLGKKHNDAEVTYANILGNTKVQMDGGSWIWDRKADTSGDIITWQAAQSDGKKICTTLDEFMQIVRAIQNASSVNDIAYPKAKDAMERILSNERSTKEFFSLDALEDGNVNIQKGRFKKNHNIYGGGNRACNVSGEAVVELNHSPLADLYDMNGRTQSLLDYTTLPGLCMYLVSRNTTHPQFSVFGAGYGANTTVGSTKVLAQTGAMVKTTGELYDIGGKKYRYLNQEADRQKYTAYEENLFRDFMAVSPEDRKLYYGSTDGSYDDPRTFNRYYASRMAWSLGIPGSTFLEIHGGGFSGYVTGDTYVEANNQLTCLNIYGAGLGAKPYGTLDEQNANKYDFGTVSGSSKVFFKSGNVSQNVYGGGAGIESVHVNGSIVDFPNMARVKKSEVHVYGESVGVSPLLIDRTFIVGSVYGGGDVANVGEEAASTEASILGQDDYLKSSNYTSLVDIRGGSILSEVFAGGKGRTKAECNDYTKLGGIYGNAFVVTDRPAIRYPYYLFDKTTEQDTTYTAESLNPADEKFLKHPADDVNATLFPNILGRIYGGCQNGTVYGNTLVNIRDGKLFSNIFGGGWGNALSTAVVGEESSEATNAVSTELTSADVKGNTNLFITGGEARLYSYWLADLRTWEPATIVSGHTYSPQYNPMTQKFKINHNIYGGGNEACTVANTYLTIEKGLLYNTTPVLSGVEPANFFETNEWKQVYLKQGSPHFCVFGGGYGENTNILSDTHINIDMASRGSKIDPSIDFKEGEDYRHFFSGYSMMDIVGGGYSGKVTGVTHIDGVGGAFCRRVFGGGFYNSVDSTNVNLKAIDCHDIFGGGLMGDVVKGTSIILGSHEYNEGDTYSNKDIYVHGNIYGANDVSGYVNVGVDAAGYFIDKGGDGTHIEILGGRISGNVYGAGNGDYLYALDRKGNTKVTVNENYPLTFGDPNSETEPLVYTVPMRDNMPSYKAASDAAKLVNINSWRPLTNKATIKIAGTASDTVRILGDVYGGGNSASILKVQAYKTKSTNDVEGFVKLNICDHVEIGRVFMGCNGDALFAATEDNDFMNKFQKLNGDVYDSSKELDISDTIDWVNDPSNKGISTLYLSTKNEDRPSVYPHLLDLYFQPVETDIQGVLMWNGTEKGETLKNVTIGSFCCGGNRGNMNVYPADNGNVLEYYFPKGLTITDKIVGGCYNANYSYKNQAYHEGGYLLGLGHSAVPFIKLNVDCQFSPTEQDGAYVGGNVYGGCYRAGTIRGDVTIKLKSDMLEGKSKEKLEKSNELLASNPSYSALNVYGAGFGLDSYVYGNTHVVMADSVICKEPTTTSKTDASGKTTETTFEGTGTSANFVYGGGQQGNLIGTTTIEILNGHVFKSVTGGSYSGYVWGSTNIKVGYPRYYRVRSPQAGRYLLNRTDQENKDIDKDKKVAHETIKQYVNLLVSDYVSQAVYNDIYAKYDSISGTNIAISGDDKGKYFEEMKAETPFGGWDNVHIKIGEAVYGGGYSLANGSSVMANNTTVLKFTKQYNVDTSFQYDDIQKEELKGLPGSTTAGFGGNTTILVADRFRANDEEGEATPEDRDHITISRQDMKVANVDDGQDLLGYYYKCKEKDENGDIIDDDSKYHYAYIYQAGKYYKGGTISDGTLPADMIGEDVYTYDNDGGIFGDGHLSYAEGFRTADLAGYGFASSTVSSPKILNTFQRLDILRLTDNCFSLLGARDYATNATDMTPYSISRVGEIQMNYQDIVTNNGVLNGKDKNRARNYMGLANNILYVGALYSNVNFDNGTWRDHEGKEGEYQGNNTYRSVKQKYIDDYYSTDGSNANKGNDPTFEKRNDGTAANMIGIASGYALKIQNVQELLQADGTTDEKLYYGPVYGVIEMNLIDTREDEGGGYVYADNIHKRSDGKDHDFLETTGNFVFPYSKADGRYIVDDCFPVGYASLEKGKTPDEEIEGHYWYVTGFNYHYTAHITGFTMNNTTPLLFNSNNNDGIVALSGLKAKQKVNIVSWKMHSAHQKLNENTAYSCDLEQRNYSPDSLDMSGKHLCSTDAEGKVMDTRYKLYVGASNASTFEKPNEADSTTGFGAQLSMWEKATEDGSKLLKSKLPNELSHGDARIVFQLQDEVDNSTTDYYQRHLSQPCSATLTLEGEALDNEGKPVVRLTTLNRLYKQKDDKYEEADKESTLESGATYYYRSGETDYYQELRDTTSFYTRDRNDENSSLVKVDKNQVQLGSDTKIYYCYVPRHYTYTIDLTIEYVQGPDIDGHITIANCALPGEMIRLKKDQVEVKADQSIAVTGYYWRIGKRHYNVVDGKKEWAFDCSTPWSKSSAGSTVTDENGYYDTYHVSDAAGKGLFANCYYDKTDDYLDIPAYYFMNGYGVQLGVTMNIKDHTDIIPVGMLEADSLLIHNYQRMDPNNSTVDLHLKEAIDRAKAAEGTQTYKDYFTEPRIYISNNADLAAFLDFLQKDKGHGANAQFVILNDLNIPTGYTANGVVFSGVLHGNGHVIHGLGKGNSFIGENQGQIYNLGLESGSIATNGSTNGGAYHCCFEYAPTEDASPIVYHINGDADDSYNTEDFRSGRVTYDLNEYYLLARHARLGGELSDDEKKALKYVYDYYANGDYQYSRRKDEITGTITGYTYLRTGKDSDLPNYWQAESRHDQNHTIDPARAIYETEDKDDGTTVSKFVGYEALFDGNNSGAEELMNDYPYWGQQLQSTPEDYPQELASQQVNMMTNRVYRTAGYYGDTKMDVFHYNAYNLFNTYVGTYVHDTKTTAIDFTCQNDLEAKSGWTTAAEANEAGKSIVDRGISYPPVADNATTFYNFQVKDGVSQNLLVYTAANSRSESEIYEAYDVVDKALAYDETTSESLIKGHHIVATSVNADTNESQDFATDLFHLVERTADNKNSEGDASTNNNFCAPIEFKVSQHAWYTRQPLNYANASDGAWEGICLPFTASQTEASLNGEITHFYGMPSSEEEADPRENVHTLHHEYWLRGLTDVTEDGKAATFLRPGTKEEELFVANQAESMKSYTSYTYKNSFFVDTYGDRLYNKVDNSFYDMEAYENGHTYEDYPLLTVNAPYIVRFPGERYYEFDLSSKFYNNLLGRSAAAQTVTFHAYGEDAKGDDIQRIAVVVPITDATLMKTDVKLESVGDTYSHQGTFAAKPVANGVYGMNEAGTAFVDDASTIETVMPFRTYMTRETTSTAKSRAAAPSEIRIAELKSGDEIRPELGDKDESEASNDYLTVRSIGEHRVSITSTIATELKVYSVTGQLYRILDVQPGTATYSGFYPALYIFGDVKVMVK